MADEWFYQRNGQNFGPFSPQALRQLAIDGFLFPNDMVTKTGMNTWAPASKVNGLFAVSGNQPAPIAPNPPAVTFGNIPPPPPIPNPAPTPDPFPFAMPSNAPPLMPPAIKPPAVPASGGVISPFGSAFGGLSRLMGSSATPSAPLNNPVAPPSPNSAIATTSITTATATAPPPRLPDGLDPSDVLIDHPAHYQGGHPELHRKTEGRFILAKTGLYFVGETSDSDLGFPVERIRDVLKPIVGEFPPKMLNQANMAKTGAAIGAGAAKFAGTLIGGFGGRVVKATGGAASDTFKGVSALGPPPKNRITIVFLDANQFAHKVLFDFGGSIKVELEQRADEFWMRVSSIRSRFFGASRPTPAAKQATRSVAGPSSPALNLGSGEFRLLTPGSPVETVSGTDLSERLQAGAVGFGTLVCLELWVPVHTLAAFTGLTGGSGGIVKGSGPSSGRSGDGESSGSAQGSTGSTKGKSSGSRGSGTGKAIAAGVAGAVVGAVTGAAISNAMRKKGAGVSVDETSDEETDEPIENEELVDNVEQEEEEIDADQHDDGTEEDAAEDEPHDESDDQDDSDTDDESDDEPEEEDEVDDSDDE